MSKSRTKICILLLIVTILAISLVSGLYPNDRLIKSKNQPNDFDVFSYQNIFNLTAYSLNNGSISFFFW